MKCPECSKTVLGGGCLVCDYQRPNNCPDCEAPYAGADRFCRQCGRDLTWINSPVRDPLRFPLHLLAEDFEHPRDLSGLKRLRKLGPLRELARVYLRTVSLPVIQANLLGGSVRVSATQFPRVHRIAGTCAEILDTPMVDLFIGKNHPSANLATALTFGTNEKGCIFVESDHFDYLTDRELLFVLGREFGHIKSRHLIYLTIARTLSGIFGSHPRLSGFILPLFSHLMTPWLRAAELSADRAGLICSQSFPSSVSAMLKCELTGENSKNFLSEINIEEFAKQGEILDKDYRWVPPESDRPFLTKRLQELHSFNYSATFKAIFLSASTAGFPRVACRECKILSYLDSPETRFGQVPCSKCNGLSNLERLVCPHCDGVNHVEDLDAACDSLLCSHCGQKILDEYAPPIRKKDELYSSLDLDRAATRVEIERAYVEHARPFSKLDRTSTASSFTDVEMLDRIRVHKAYQTLSSPQLRSFYNLLLEQYEGENDRTGGSTFILPLDEIERCTWCCALKLGKHCSICGRTKDDSGEESVDDGKNNISIPLPDSASSARKRLHQETTTNSTLPQSASRKSGKTS